MECSFKDLERYDRSCVLISESEREDSGGRQQERTITCALCFLFHTITISYLPPPPACIREANSCHIIAVALYKIIVTNNSMDAQTCTPSPLSPSYNGGRHDWQLRYPFYDYTRYEPSLRRTHMGRRLERLICPEYTFERVICPV